MYVAYGSSFISEMDAFNKAISFVKEIGLSVDSIRLDRYYSSRKVINLFGKSVSLFFDTKEEPCQTRPWVV